MIFCRFRSCIRAVNVSLREPHFTKVINCVLTVQVNNSFHVAAIPPWLAWHLTLRSILCLFYYFLVSSTNAYMLMYRKVDQSRNTVFLDRKQWPDHIKCLATKLHEDEEEEANKKEMDRNTCKVSIWIEYLTFVILYGLTLVFGKLCG